MTPILPRLTTVMILVLPLLSACSAVSTPDDTMNLHGTAWTLAALAGQPALAGNSATLRFADGQVQGTDGCNRYSGPYSADAGGLRISNLAATMMACVEPVMGQAQAFMSALSATRSARLANGQLLLLDETDAVLAQLDPESQALAGTSWEVTGINNGKAAVASVVAGARVTLTFGADGKVTGSAGCNNYTANWSADGTAVTIGMVAATRKMCATPGVMEQEMAFLKALPMTATARVEARRLELRAADGALLVNATRN